jgi:hypothetical protein
MNFNIINPAIAEHYQARDLAIRKLIDMHNDDYDISDEKIFYSVLERYGLLGDGFESEVDYIVEAVMAKID